MDEDSIRAWAVAQQAAHRSSLLVQRLSESADAAEVAAAANKAEQPALSGRAPEAA